MTTRTTRFFDSVTLPASTPASLVGAAMAFATVLEPAGGPTIEVDTSGGPQAGRCNITDAIQAATTNAAVHGCRAGSPTATDTIVLRANTVYQAYGKPLLVPGTGGPLTIRGTLSGSVPTTVIRAPNYGFPSPDPATTEACPHPAALVTGGALTLRNLVLEAADEGTIGICQYAGSLTLDHVVVGDDFNDPPAWGFTRGGMRSYPNRANTHRAVTLTNGTEIVSNTSPDDGAGVSLFGDVDTTMNALSLVENNRTDGSGAGIFWSGRFGKMGNLTIDHSLIALNVANAGWGGGLYLGGDDPRATVTIGGAVEILENRAGHTGGGIFIERGVGPSKVIVSGATIENNVAFADARQVFP